jgi:hypothetical protein
MHHEYCIYVLVATGVLAKWIGMHVRMQAICTRHWAMVQTDSDVIVVVLSCNIIMFPYHAVHDVNVCNQAFVLIPLFYTALGLSTWTPTVIIATCNAALLPSICMSYCVSCFIGNHII